jgi:hypothetical protein
MRIIASRFKRTSYRFGVATCLAFTFAAANAQSFNVDVDISNGNPLGGAGAPSSAFGAAANQPGVWNALPAQTISGFGLLDLQGNATSVSASCVGSGGAVGFNNPGNTGDFNFLLNDADRIGTGSLRYTLSNLANGFYRIFTYSVRPNVTQGSSDITVAGATIPTVHVAGVMPGNSFILGVTHAIHEVNVTNGTLQIRADGSPNDYINGFQIVSVPEPTPVIALTALLILVWLPLKSRR